MKSIQKLLWLFALVALALNTACDQSEAPADDSGAYEPKGSGSEPAIQPDLDASKDSGSAPEVKPEAAKEPEAAKKMDADKAPETAKESEVAKEPDAPKKAEAVKQSEAAKKTDAAKEPEAAKKTDAAKEPDAAKKADADKAPEAAKETDADKAPEAAKKADAAMEPDAAKKPQGASGLTSSTTSSEELTPVAAETVKPAAGVGSSDADNGSSEWPQWGRDASNNMVAFAKGVPTEFSAGEVGDDGEVTGAEGAKWVVKLGSQTYGTPTIANGQVYVGTNNEEPRNEKIIGDRGVVMVFDEATGDFKWQLTSHKLGAGKVSDWEFLGMCSSVTVDGKYGYVVTNRGEVLCFDTYGLSDGNDGPYKDEAKYLGGEDGEPMDPSDIDADIVWVFDMRDELGVFPHNITSSSVVVHDDTVYASTSNGVDWTHLNKPAPQAPCLVALNKHTGELVGEEGSQIGERVMHCNWSSPGFSSINGKPEVIFGAGDGFVYGFDPKPVKDEEGFDILPEIWKVDCCPKEYRFDEEGEPIKYATYPGPSEIISSPVVYNDKVYVAIGQDPEHGEGVGALTCIDPLKGNGQDAIVWQFKEIGRSISTPSIVDGLVYISDYAGKLYCLDADTGQKYWEHDTLSHIWGSTTVVDGKVFLGNEDGELAILKAGKEYEEINVIEFPSSIYSSVVVANNAFYVTTNTHLYAFKIGE